MTVKDISYDSHHFHQLTPAFVIFFHSFTHPICHLPVCCCESKCQWRGNSCLMVALDERSSSYTRKHSLGIMCRRYVFTSIFMWYNPLHHQWVEKNPTIVKLMMRAAILGDKLQTKTPFISAMVAKINKTKTTGWNKWWTPFTHGINMWSRCGYLIWTQKNAC